MNYFSKNLKYLRKKNGVEQMQLAEHLGRKSSSSISDWEKGKYTPKTGTLNEIAKYFHVSLSELVEEDLSKIPSNVSSVSKTIPIPILGTIACGEPITAEENIEGYREEVSDFLPGGNLFYLKTKGDSMTPTIPLGSYVLIREQPEVEDGEIAAVLVNGDTEATLKRIKRQGDIVMLVPDNSDYQPYIITEDNPAKILGKAIKFSADL